MQWRLIRVPPHQGVRTERIPDRQNGLSITERMAEKKSTHESHFVIYIYIYTHTHTHTHNTVSVLTGTAVAQWLRCSATKRKAAGSIPAGVSGFFVDIKSFRSHYGPGVDSASNRNEYQEYFLGVNVVGA